MGSPIQGGGRGSNEPSWKELFQSEESKLDRGGDDGGGEELDSRISSHVDGIFDQNASSGIRSAGASSEANNDLQGRVEQGTEQGFFSSILARVRRAVTGLWGATRRGRETDDFTQGYRDLFLATELPHSTHAEPRSRVPSALRHCLESMRSFFLGMFHRICGRVHRQEVASVLDFRGADPRSAEGTVALALMLRMASKSSLRASEEYGEAASPSLPVDEKELHSWELFAHTLPRLERLLGEDVQDPLAAARGLAKLACSSHTHRVSCRGDIKSLSEVDLGRDYTEILSIAHQLDVFAKQGPEEQNAVQMVLHSVRANYHALLGSFLSIWSIETPQGELINYDLVVEMVEANLPLLQEARERDPQLHDRMLNEIIRRFLFVTSDASGV